MKEYLTDSIEHMAAETKHIRDLAWDFISHIRSLNFSREKCGLKAGRKKDQPFIFHCRLETNIIS